ncbi:MAG: hypothetical protein HKN21_10560 [Candidatus Eisenbacteria bacterium]|uniref:TonB C-terminal domain-containing protein n=1 Tax=Eiseniibacteriota bacterium TaxID=2212470 RepID=A0A7Y2H2M5_UNCEI|nr:hypothetical protein [Candidatus Eisenbacteria bacterium]
MRQRAFGMWLGVSVALHAGLFLLPGVSPVSIPGGAPFVAVVVLEYEEPAESTPNPEAQASGEPEATPEETEEKPQTFNTTMPDDVPTPEDPLALTSELEFDPEPPAFSSETSAPKPVITPQSSPQASSPGEGSDAPSESRVSPPRLIVGALPLTSKDRDRLQVPEEIMVRLRVGATGRVEDVEFVTPGLPPDLRDVLLRSTEVMRFAPAKEGSQHVPSWFPMTFVYRR